MKKTPIRLALIPTFALIGTGASIYLSSLFYSIRSGEAGFKSLCNISETMNCNVVAMSKWAELPFGIPLSSVAAGWLIALLVLGLLARSNTWKKEAIQIGLWMSAWGTLCSLFLIYVMGALLKIWCPFCLVIDATNFILLGLFWSLKEGSFFEGVGLSRIKSASGIILASILVVIIFTIPSKSEKAPLEKEATQALVHSILNGTPTEIKASPLSPVIGNESAPITIVEFSDFQCPYCRIGASVLHAVQSRFGKDQIKIIYRPFPLDQACNRLVNQPLHIHACELARAAFCAHQQGQFEPVYQDIFDHQETLSSSSALNIALSHGLNESEFKTCMESEETKRYIRDEIEEGARLNVQSTPTFYLNGKKIEGGISLETWNLVIQELLKQK